MWIRGADKWEHTEKGCLSCQWWYLFPLSLLLCLPNYLCCLWVHGEREGGLFFSEDGCQLYILPLILKTGGGAICVSSGRDQITVSKKNEVHLSAGARSIRVYKSLFWGLRSVCGKVSVLFSKILSSQPAFPYYSCFSCLNINSKIKWVFSWSFYVISSCLFLSSLIFFPSSLLTYTFPHIVIFSLSIFSFSSSSTTLLDNETGNSCYGAYKPCSHDYFHNTSPELLHKITESFRLKETSGGHLVQHFPYLSSQLRSLPETVFSWILGVSKNGDSITSLSVWPHSQ